MAVNGHNDTFTINDITFKVPPSEIRIQKEAANFEWQTLRTKSAQRVKSGHGVVTISLTTAFIGLEAINSQLRPLICQLRLTPICYVENQYLREHLLAGEPDKNMALILKSLELQTQAEPIDTIVVNFTFGWFNYLPYSDKFMFKQDVALPIPVKTPAESDAWKKFYTPELDGFNTYPPTPKLESSADFKFSEYKIVQDEPELDQESLNDQTTMTATNGGDFTVTAPARNKVNPLEEEGFKPTLIQYPSTAGTDYTLYEKEHTVQCLPQSDLVIVGITIVFDNIVAALPILGHQYSTYQHIGSVDPMVIVKVLANGDNARARVNRMWNLVETNAIKFRHIEQK